MSWFGNLWNGMSPCMEPGVNGCVVLWEAWAALGSFLAVAVALAIGAAPILFRRRQARAIALIVRVKVDQQLLHVGASLYAVGDGPHTGMEDNVAIINFGNCDPDAVRELIPYFDVVPTALADSLARCIVEVETAHRLLSMRGYRDRGDKVLGSVVSGVLMSVEDALAIARERLQAYTGHVDDVDMKLTALKMGESLKHLARLADKDPTKDEQWLRRHIVGVR